MEGAAMTTQKRGISGTGLKIIAMVAMFIDHFAAILLQNYLSSVSSSFQNKQEYRAWLEQNSFFQALDDSYLLLRLIGRFGFPLFAFLIVEGFSHTRSVKYYALRLGAFALISEIPFNLGFDHKFFYPNSQNVFFTLLIGLLCLASMQYFGETKKESEKLRPLFYFAAPVLGAFAAYMFLHVFELGRETFPLERVWLLVTIAIAAALSTVTVLLLGRKWDTARRNAFSATVLSSAVFCGIAALLRTDYSSGGVLTIILLYLFRKNRTLAFTVACAELTMYSSSEFTTFLMLIPLAHYNGKRGGGLNKYVFYAFYPVHIGLLYLVTLLLGYVKFAWT